MLIVGIVLVVVGLLAASAFLETPGIAVAAAAPASGARAFSAAAGSSTRPQGSTSASGPPTARSAPGWAELAADGMGRAALHVNGKEPS